MHVQFFYSVLRTLQWGRFGVYSVNIHLIDSRFDIRRRSIDSWGVNTDTELNSYLNLYASCAH